MRFILVAVLVVLLAVRAAAAESGAGAPGFALCERLGRQWTNECVTFPLTAEQRESAKRGLSLVGPDGKEIAWQLVKGEDEASSRICFQADLPPCESRAYQFSGKPASVKSDLEIQESADEVRVANRFVGLAIRKTLREGQGPIAGIRLRSGIWTGSSALTLKIPLSAFATEIKARGPVFAEVVCRATFADEGRWTLHCRVERAEPVVLIDEHYDAPAGGEFRVVLGDKTFQPTHLMCRNSDVTSAIVMSDKIANYYLEPWLHWNNPRQGNWIALYTPTPIVPGADKKNLPDGVEPEHADKPKDAAPDTLAVGVLRPSLWVDPQWKGRAEQLGPGVRATVQNGLVGLDMPIRGGRRLWLLGALDKATSEGVLLQNNRRVAPPPQQLIIKHGDFPLDRVKDFVLDWEGDGDKHPLLYVRQQDLPALRARLKSDPAELKRWTGQQPIDKYLLDGPVREFIASGDARLGKLMVAKAEEYLQNCVDWYLKQDERLTPGAAPHMQTLIITVVNLLDPALSTEAVTPEARKRILAKLAFIGYVVSSPDYWSPERGYSGFANMTSVVALYRTALGCMLPSHPQGKAWAEQGLKQLYWQLGAWSDEDGGWLEAPHYAMVSFDHMLAGFAMAANAGFSDHAFDPRMRKVLEWFAGISTPRDSRIGGFRHQPPIGNTYHGEPTGLYGMTASLWRARDPDFAARMQWLFEQGGSFGGLGIGWNFPSMLGYGFLMNQSGVTPKPADFGSALFRKTGVVLRNTMASDRETYLHMIAGSNHDHYDFDSGGIILYGKGRVLSDDWGYIGRHADKWHSMLTAPAAGGGGIMQVTSFAPAAAFDYVAGSKDAWQRQIAFAKDTDPLGPNFFLVRDTYAGDGDAVWRLWLTTAISAGGNNKTATPGTVSLTASGATLAGMDDVDLDISLYEPASLGLRLEPATLKAGVGNYKGAICPVENSQTALVGTLKGRGAIAALLYPRLKTEPSPTVAWSAQGRIAEVRSKSGTDYVFITPKAAAKPAGDGKTLEPLREVTAKDDLTIVALAVDKALCVTVNRAKAAFSEGTRKMPVEGIALHPGAVLPATAVWQSPVAGTVSVDVRLADGNPGGGDGILAELRHGSKVLSKAALANGGEPVSLRATGVSVAKGALVRLVILPGEGRNANWFDTTITEMVVKDAAGGRWDLRESLVRGEPLGNQLDQGWEKAVWWVCSGDAETFDPKTVAPPVLETYTSADGKASFQGTAGAIRVRGDGKTTITLGATGKIRIGDKELSAQKPAAKE